MSQRAAFIVVVTILAVVSPATGWTAASEPGQQKNQEPARPKAEPKTQPKTQEGSSLTGCVDQQDGQYVLIDDRSRTPIADLVADGFPTEGFAKHVGHKITVRGTATSGGTRTVVKVRSIETISDSCVPQPQGKI